MNNCDKYIALREQAEEIKKELQAMEGNVLQELDGVDGKYKELTRYPTYKTTYEYEKETQEEIDKINENIAKDQDKIKEIEKEAELNDKVKVTKDFSKFVIRWTKPKDA